ncbi:MAG TPA: hypothetical protein DHW82_07930 [Spirochaetia bacterium]|nr:MAG: hypothetical protein A2Y41_08195 [Spirochaetes bacterium GWB1_36_13]HCL56921.1 hypothetical protein [Spirochaetia bacterium]
MARVELQDNWKTEKSESEIREALPLFFKKNKIKIMEETESHLKLKQGSQFLTRLIGGWFVPGAWLPKKISLEIAKEQSGSQITVLIEESLGIGIMDSMFKKKYSAYFETLMEELKKSI